MGAVSQFLRGTRREKKHAAWQRLPLLHSVDTTWYVYRPLQTTRGLPLDRHFTLRMGTVIQYMVFGDATHRRDTDENDARCTHQMSHKYGQQQTRDI